MEKNGEVTTDSHSDFDLTKKAVYYDGAGEQIADEANKDKLKKPLPIDSKPPRGIFDE